MICFYGGDGTITSVNNENILPADIKLYQNYPNPFNPKTIINYELRSAGFVTLKVYNIKGEEITVPVNENQHAGYYEIRFDGSDIPSEIYFYSLYNGANIIDTKRMILLK